VRICRPRSSSLFPYTTLFRSAHLFGMRFDPPKSFPEIIMTFRLYDLPEIEPSRSVGFSGNRIDRQSEKRQDDSAFTALELPQTRIMLLGGNRLLLDYADEKAPRALFRFGEAKEFAPDLQEPVLLGLQDGMPLVALTTQLDPEAMEAP